MAGWSNDPGLDTDGQLQVRKLAEYIRRSFAYSRFEVIYTSPLPRAKQTAEILGTVLALPLSEDHTLKDINLGDWTGQPVATVATSDLGKLYFRDPVGVRLPNGEGIAEVLERVIPTIELIRKKAISGSAIVVSHLEVIKLIIAHYTDHDLHHLHRLEKIPTGSGLMVSFLQDKVQVKPLFAS